jgi:hypothetical protein
MKLGWSINNRYICLMEKWFDSGLTEHRKMAKNSGTKISNDQNVCLWNLLYIGRMSMDKMKNRKNLLNLLKGPVSPDICASLAP